MENYDFASKIHEMSTKGESFVVATVVKTEGSSLAKPGFKVVVFDDKIIYGTLGGACPESVILDEARKVLDSGTPKNIRIHLEDAGKGIEAMISRQVQDEIFVETFCGGTIDVFLEPFRPFERLVLIGQGGREILVKHRKEVVSLEIEDPDEVADIDSPQDLEHAMEICSRLEESEK